MHLFRQLFAVFLASRRTVHHFRSKFLFESLPKGKASRALPDALADQLTRGATDNLDAVFARLGSGTEGLSTEQADAIRKTAGPNEVNHEKPLPWWLHLWLSYKNPFNLLLSLLALVSWLTADTKAAVVISSMVMLSTAMRFFQERRSNRAAQSLKELVSNNTSVIRRDEANSAGQTRELAVKLLVPGDIVVLSAGDMVPADCRLLRARDLFVSQSAMTGESLPLEKFTKTADQNIGPLEMPNLLFMGTNVVSGSATALVLTTGNHTYFGTLATRATAEGDAVTAFQSGVNEVTGC